MSESTATAPLGNMEFLNLTIPLNRPKIHIPTTCRLRIPGDSDDGVDQVVNKLVRGCCVRRASA